MLGLLAWALATWLKLTLFLTAAVAGLVWWLGADHGAAVLAVVVAALLEVHLTRALFGECTHEVRSQWWWTQ